MADSVVEVVETEAVHSMVEVEVKAKEEAVKCMLRGKANLSSNNMMNTMMITTVKSNTIKKILIIKVHNNSHLPNNPLSKNRSINLNLSNKLKNRLLIVKSNTILNYFKKRRKRNPLSMHIISPNSSIKILLR